MIPNPLWFVLIFSALTIFVYMLFFADPGERAYVQAMMIGTVAAVIVATLLLIRFLDNPYASGFGGLKPVTMERTLALLDQARVVVGDRGPLPCDARGSAQ